MVDLTQDVWKALRSSYTVLVPGSCFGHNESLETLRNRKDKDLIDAIESVMTSCEFLHAFTEDRKVSRNTDVLLNIYFRLADRLAHDTIAFLDRLTSPIRQKALREVFRVWGPGGYNRLTEIPKTLFDYFCNSLGSDAHWTVVMNRYQRIGILRQKEA